jgi:MYXO-CTERM domain-containing protein
MDARPFSLVLLLALLPSSARAAEPWQLWADDDNGMVAGTNPSIAISSERVLFYTYLAPQSDAIGEVYRVDLDDPNRQFSKMPGFPLPVPPNNGLYGNVGSLAINARAEPIVGVSINANFQSFDPMLFTWDSDTSQWLAADIIPADKGCTHSIRKIALAPNGDVWASCQWSGAYHSIDDGRTFDYVDVTAAVIASEPSYIPTRANGASDLGALFTLIIGPDGNIYIGSESGGVVYSDDEGESFRPLDQDPTNPMSTMARATNSGNVAAVGLTPDGKVIVQGAAGQGAYPPPGTIGLWVFDIAAQTTDTAVGLPDYMFNGLTAGQIVTLPSGRIYMHSDHDNVDVMTGQPTLGGIVSSNDAITWEFDNAGIDAAFMIPNMNVWYDGNGRGEGHPFATDGDDIYVATTTAQIYVRYGDSGSDTDTGTDTGDTTGDTTTTNGASGTDGSSSASETGESSGTGSDGPNAAGDSGCGCRSDERSTGLAPLAFLALLGWRRRSRVN